MVKLITVCLLTVLSLSCNSPEPVKIDETPNKVKIELILEYDGCKVYRFEGRHYFTKCVCYSNAESRISENCGKNCTRMVSENIPTSYSRVEMQAERFSERMHREEEQRRKSLILTRTK